VYSTTSDQSNENDACDQRCTAEYTSVERNAAKIEDSAVQKIFPVACRTPQIKKCKAQKWDDEELRRLSFSTTEPQSEPEGELLNPNLDSSSDDFSDEDEVNNRPTKPFSNHNKIVVILVSLTWNVDYQQLSADDKDELMGKVQDSFAKSAGVDPSAVIVTLTAGSDKVDVIIRKADANSAESIEKSMKETNIALEVLEDANSIPGVKAAANEELAAQVTNLEVNTVPALSSSTVPARFQNNGKDDHECLIPAFEGSHSSIDLSVDDTSAEVYTGRVYWLETTNEVQMHLSSLGDIHDIQNVRVNETTINYEHKMGDDSGASGDDEDEDSLQVADRVHQKSQALLKMLSEALLDSKPSRKDGIPTRSFDKPLSRTQSDSLSRTQSLSRLEPLTNRCPQGRGRQYPVGLKKYQPLSEASASEKYQPLDLSKSISRVLQRRGPFRSDFSRLQLGGKRANGKKEAPKDAQRLESQVDRLEEQSKDLMRLLSDALKSDDESIMKTQ
jgi:hypothetical protein